MKPAGLSRQHHVHIIIDSFLDECRRDPDQFFRVDDPEELIPAEDRDKLLANGSATMRSADTMLRHKPVIELRGPDDRGTWLLAELAPECPSFALALTDDGQGLPELVYVDLDELQAIGCTRNVFFAPKPGWSLHDYARKAAKKKRIVI